MDGRLLGLGFASLLALASGTSGSRLKAVVSPHWRRWNIVFERSWDEDSEIIANNHPGVGLVVAAVKQLRAELDEAMEPHKDGLFEIDLVSGEAEASTRDESMYVIRGFVSSKLPQKDLVEALQERLYDKGSVSGFFEISEVQGSKLKAVAAASGPKFELWDRVTVHPPADFYTGRVRPVWKGVVIGRNNTGGMHVDDPGAPSGWRETLPGEWAYVIGKTRRGGGVWWLEKFLVGPKFRRKKKAPAGSSLRSTVSAPRFVAVDVGDEGSPRWAVYDLLGGHLFHNSQGAIYPGVTTELSRAEEWAQSINKNPEAFPSYPPKHKGIFDEAAEAYVRRQGLHLARRSGSGLKAVKPAPVVHPTWRWSGPVILKRGTDVSEVYKRIKEDYQAAVAGSGLGLVYDVFGENVSGDHHVERHVDPRFGDAPLLVRVVPTPESMLFRRKVGPEGTAYDPVWRIDDSSGPILSDDRKMIYKPYIWGRSYVVRHK